MVVSLKDILDLFLKAMKHGIDIRSKQPYTHFHNGSKVFDSFYKLNLTLLMAVFNVNFAFNVAFCN